MCRDLDVLHFSFARQALPLLPFHHWINWNPRPFNLSPEDLVLILHILLVKSAKICLKMQLWLILIK